MRLESDYPLKRIRAFFRENFRRSDGIIRLFERLNDFSCIEIPEICRNVEIPSTGGISESGR